MPYIDPKVWVKTWKEAGPRLEAIRREEIRRTDHVAMVAAFDDVFEYALTNVEPTTTSGLVEQQRIFARAPRGG